MSRRLDETVDRRVEAGLYTRARILHPDTAALGRFDTNALIAR
jgi:hypothetical protein